MILKTFHISCIPNISKAANNSGPGRLCLLASVLGIALSISGCSTQEMPATEPEGKDRKMILFGGISLKELSWHDGRNTSNRANEKEIPSDIPLDFGVFAFGDGPNRTYVFNNQPVVNKEHRDYKSNPFNWPYQDTTYDVEDWPYHYEGTEAASWPYPLAQGTSVQLPWDVQRYRFFAYSPWHNSNNVSVAAENFQGFNTFTWDRIPGFTESDYVLSNEIVEMDNREGNFTTTGNIVHFSMRHILARIRFFFKTSTAYHQIRRIKLNSLTITSAGRVKSATFNFKNNAWDETVHWSKEEYGLAPKVVLQNSKDTDYFIPYSYDLSEPFNCVYVYPQDQFDQITMEIDYEVYDSKDICTRTAKITNTVNIPNWTLLSGYYYDVKINIVPDYLYVLSDNDQDFDGYVIIQDNTNPGELDPDTDPDSPQPR